MISKGSQVQFHYTLSVDGEQVESSAGKEPLSYTHGEDQIIPGLERELEGMAVGGTKEVTVSPEDGYGQRDSDAVQEFPRDSFEDPDKMEVGIMVHGQDQDGNAFQATITEVTDENITLDFNHPMAGKTLTFAVEIAAVA